MIDMRWSTLILSLSSIHVRVSSCPHVSGRSHARWHLRKAGINKKGDDIQDDDYDEMDIYAYPPVAFGPLD